MSAALDIARSACVCVACLIAGWAFAWLCCQGFRLVLGWEPGIDYGAGMFGGLFYGLVRS